VTRCDQSKSLVAPKAPPSTATSPSQQAHLRQFPNSPIIVHCQRHLASIACCSRSGLSTGPTNSSRDAYSRVQFECLGLDLTPPRPTRPHLFLSLVHLPQLPAPALSGCGGARPARWVTRTAVSVLAQTSSSRLDSVVVATAKCPELGSGGEGLVGRYHG
jgi:hypothetical protein